MVRKMSAEAMMQTIYKEVKALQRDVEGLKRTLVSVEKTPLREAAELKRIQREMESGKEKSFRDISALLGSARPLSFGEQARAMKKWESPPARSKVLRSFGFDA